MSEFKCPHSVDCANYEPKKKPLFADLKVGEYVYSECFGVGEVSDIDDDDDYPIYVVFEDDFDWFTLDGLYLESNEAPERNIIRKVDKPKPSNLTMTEAFDLLDSGEAKLVTRKNGLYNVRLINGCYVLFDLTFNIPITSAYIREADRKATDWYVVE